MPLAFPKLRGDLVKRPRSHDDSRTFIVKNPATGAFYTLGETEWFIVERCDGATPLEEIRRSAETELGGTLAPQALDSFIRSLEKAGMLETERGRERVARIERRRWKLRGNLLHLRLPIYDPEALLARLSPRVEFLFTPGFVAIASALIVLAAFVVGSQLEAVRTDLVRLFAWSTLPLLWFTAWGVVAAHELGHGFACKHFGGQVREMGLMLLYLQPAAYCNVSDAWLFPERWKRLWVSLAGPFFELFLWALAALVWRVTEPVTWIHDVALIVVVTSGVKTLVNFIPILKLDGYYILSDLLEVPNLRGRAFRYVGNRIRTALGLRAVAPETPAPRERRILLAYGTVASVLSIGFLLVAVSQLGTFLVQEQPWLFAGALGMVAIKAPRKFRRLFGGADPALEDDDPDDDTAPRTESAAVPAGGEPDATTATSAPKPRRLPSPRTLLLLGGGLLAVLGIAFGRMELAIRGSFDALPVRDVVVRAGVAGIVDEIRVSEGEQVRAGDVIARIAAPEMETELREVEARIDRAQADLALLRDGATRAERAAAQAAVGRARAQLDYARHRLKIEQSLLEQNIISQREVEATELQALTAQHDLAESEGRLASLLAGPRPQEIERVSAEIRELEARKELLELRTERLAVRSPIDGVIATPALQLRALRRARVVEGDAVAEVHDPGPTTAVIAVPEREIADVRVGAPVRLKARAYPDVTLEGTVVAVGATVQGSSLALAAPASLPAPAGLGAPAGGTSRTVLVTARLEQPGVRLKPDMSGQAKILCGRRSILALAQRALSRITKVQFWSWW